MAEFDLIELIRERCALARSDVRLGIGDDAALVCVPAGQLLAVSTDTLVAGIHFPEGTNPGDIGWKALAVNLSDLAAMGAEPAWATLALTLPAADERWVRGFAGGLAALAREFMLAIVGGDTTQGPLSVTMTIHGFVPESGALLRSGAHVGDGVFVTGTLGDAAAGLLIVQGAAVTAPAGGLGSAVESMRASLSLVERLNRPTPRVAQGLLLRSRASACIDVSDGLVADLRHICTASAVGAEIDLDALPASAALRSLHEAEALRGFQLGGGDDYELCFTAPESAAADLLADLARSGCPATRIGRIVREPGVCLRDEHGHLAAARHGGWEHFA